MPKRQRGIQRSYELSAAGVRARFTTRAQRLARARDLARIIEHDHALFEGRRRAHEKRVANYEREVAFLHELIAQESPLP